MKLLVDINVILDVALERPGAAASAELIDRCGVRHEAWLAWHSVATLAYLIERQRSRAIARRFVAGLLQWARVATTGHDDALRALALDATYFEDALQIAAAIACGADRIVTRNVRDFRGSPIPAVAPEAMLRAA